MQKRGDQAGLGMSVPGPEQTVSSSQAIPAAVDGPFVDSSEQDLIENQNSHEAMRPISRDQTVNLLTMIDSEIIPRLLLSHQAGHYGADGSQFHSDGGGGATGSVSDFAAILVKGDFHAAQAYVRAVSASYQDLNYDLYAPTARYLGRMWEEDEYGFGEVTVGLNLLERLVLRDEDWLETDLVESSADRTALIMAIPGEDHTFGALFVQKEFRNAGWIVHGGGARTIEELMNRIESQHYAFLGISVSRLKSLSQCGEIIPELRRRSKNRGLAIVIGGQIVRTHFAEARTIGADMIYAGAENVVEWVEENLHLEGVSV